MKVGVLLVCLAVIVTVKGAAFYNPGPCPEGRSEGSTWYESCSRCDCHEDGWGCAGCGVIAASVSCQIVQNMTAPYPECCPKVVCPNGGQPT